jgi:hypothetical protein
MQMSSAALSINSVKLETAPMSSSRWMDITCCGNATVESSTLAVGGHWGYTQSAPFLRDTGLLQWETTLRTPPWPRCDFFGIVMQCKTPCHPLLTHLFFRCQTTIPHKDFRSFLDFHDIFPKFLSWLILPSLSAFLPRIYKFIKWLPRLKVEAGRNFLV